MDGRKTLLFIRNQKAISNKIYCENKRLSSKSDGWCWKLHFLWEVQRIFLI